MSLIIMSASYCAEMDLQLGELGFNDYRSLGFDLHKLTLLWPTGCHFTILAKHVREDSTFPTNKSIDTYFDIKRLVNNHGVKIK